MVAPEGLPIQREFGCGQRAGPRRGTRPAVSSNLVAVQLAQTAQGAAGQFLLRVPAYATRFRNRHTAAEKITSPIPPRAANCGQRSAKVAPRRKTPRTIFIM